MDQSYRAFLQELDSEGQLITVEETVDEKFEVAGLLSLFDDGPAVRLNRVGESMFPIVGNLLNSRARIANAIGCKASEITEKITEATVSGEEPILVSDAHVQRNIRTASEGELLSLLPIPSFFEKDSGPYISAGLILAHEPTTGYRNASYARIKPLGGNRAFIGIAPNHHLSQLGRIAAAEGRPLEIAIAFGAHPAIQLASCFYMGLGQNELFHAASLLGEPVRVTPAKTVDVLVPADAEIVIEAKFFYDQKIHEGLVSEYHGMYEDYGDGQIIEITALTWRDDASFQVILPGLFSEHAYLGALPIGAGLVTSLRKAGIPVTDLAVTKAGGGRVNVNIAAEELKPGQAKRAFFTCWSAVSMTKQITIVDSDIDVWNYEQVEWARTSRMAWERDVVIVDGVLTDRNEPMQHGGTVTKIGMDATRKADHRKAGWDRALPPVAAIHRAQHLIGELGLSTHIAPGIGIAGLMEEE